MDQGSRVPGWLVWLVVAVLGSLAVSLLMSMILMGLPHGWETALSLTDVLLRTTLVAAVLLPAALVGYLVLSFRARLPRRPRGRVGPRPTRRGGLHR
ncbi:hypothetical protein [Streptomyces sp. NBC_01304]|uniref:hypothetical protein n=1 Tax=Streptomyces sp. NBC_01304 TaxID=2903818 RepID=UPI002E1199EF|nr:hypothetical protein OG430_04390 [Streptomyces sp. NBC_01304]